MSENLVTVNLAAGLNKRGNKALYSGEMVNAVYYFKRALALDSQNINYILDLMFALNQLAHFEESLEYGYAAIGLIYDKQEDFSVLYYLTGEALINLNYFDACIKMLELSLISSPDGPCSEDARQLLSDLKENMSEQEEDENIQGFANVAAAELLLRDGDFEGCNRILDENKELFVDNPINYLLRINALIQADKSEEALEIAVEAIKNGYSIIPVICYGIMLSVKLDNKMRIEFFKAALNSFTDCADEDIAMLADALSILDDNAFAYIIFKRLYAKNKFERQILFGFAVACIKANETSHAKELLLKLDMLEGGNLIAASLLEMLNENKETDSLLYIYEFSSDYAEKYLDMLFESDEVMLRDILKQDRTFLNIMIWLIDNQEDNEAAQILQRIKCKDTILLLELRKLAVSSQASLLTKVNAAAIVNELGEEKTVFINTGSDFVLYSEEMEKVVKQIYSEQKKAFLENNNS